METNHIIKTLNYLDTSIKRNPSQVYKNVTLKGSIELSIIDEMLVTSTSMLVNSDKADKVRENVIWWINTSNRTINFVNVEKAEDFVEWLNKTYNK